MTKLDIQNALEISEAYEKVRQVLDHIQEGKKLISEIWAIKESYNNPFRAVDIERAIERIRDDLVKEYIKKYGKALVGENVPIDTGGIIASLNKEKGDTVFDIFFIDEKLMPYIENKDELAWKEMVAKAERLIPCLWKDGKRVSKIETQKNKIILKVYIDIGYRYSYVRINYDYYSALSALEKIVDVTLTGAKPSGASGSQLRNALYGKEDSELLTTHDLFFPFSSIRVYKNGRLDLKFKHKEDCQKIAKVLKEGGIGMVYVCNCPIRYDSKEFDDWNKMPHSEASPRPPGWPESWRFGMCHRCKTMIRQKGVSDEPEDIG